MKLCKHCSMTVSATTLVCPRCRHRWPGAHALRRPALEGLAFAALTGAVAVMWIMLGSR